MRSRLTNLLLGLLIGLVISQALPVGAHGGSNPHLWKHIQSLRASYSALASDVNALRQDLTSSKNKIGVLELKTSQLDTFGLYNGRVVGENILGTINASRIGTPIYCGAGSTAVWGTYGLRC